MSDFSAPVEAPPLARMLPTPPASPPRTAPRGVSVIIPCLDEEKSIGEVVRHARAGIRATGLPGEVIVVDNGSTDRTVAIARSAGARVVEERTRGYGAALRRGFAEARFEYLAMGDGDLTYDLGAIAPFIEILARDEADLVVGNRWGDLRGGAMPPLHRYVGNPVLSALLRVMFRVPELHDMHCGMRAIRRSSWLRLGCITEGMEFASEMIVLAARRGLRLRELPISYHPRVGESKLSTFRDGWRHLRFMLLHSPSWTLLVPGAALWFSSMTALALLAFAEVRLEGRVIGIHTMLFAGLLNFVSLQLLTFGLLAKAAALLSGVRPDPPIESAVRSLTFERVLLATLPLIITGVALAIAVVLRWARGGFGPLLEAKPLFLGVLLLLEGIQILAGGYLLSVMGLRGPHLSGTREE